MTSDQTANSSLPSLGWAVQISQDVLVIVLKSAQEGAYCYVSTASSRRDPTTERVMTLSLARIDNAPLLDETMLESEVDKIMRKLQGKIALFQRVDDFSRTGSDSMKNPSKARPRAQLPDSPFLKNMRFLKEDHTDEPIANGQKAEQDMQDKYEITSEEYLIEAAEEGWTEKILALVASGTDINSRSENGLTPVHLTAFFARWETLGALLETGKCDLLIKDDYGRLPSEAAVVGHGEGGTRMEWVAKLLKLEDEQRIARILQPHPSSD